VPDGNIVAGTAMTGVKNGANVNVTWDIAACTAADYNVYVGSLSDFSAVASSNCNAGVGGVATVGIPDMSWWVVVGADDTTAISSLGRSSAGAERTLTGWSGLCSEGSQDTSGTCP
jgi:hypothetical protein